MILRSLFLQTPTISSFHPQKGPQSGGTLVTIQGEHMNAGTAILATVVGLPCIMKRWVSEQLVAYQWLNARLQYLQRINKGDIAVLHWAVIK